MRRLGAHLPAGCGLLCRVVTSLGATALAASLSTVREAAAAAVFRAPECASWGAGFLLVGRHGQMLANECSSNLWLMSALPRLQERSLRMRTSRQAGGGHIRKQAVQVVGLPCKGGSRCWENEALLSGSLQAARHWCVGVAWLVARCRPVVGERLHDGTGLAPSIAECS